MAVELNLEMEVKDLDEYLLQIFIKCVLLN